MVRQSSTWWLPPQKVQGPKLCCCFTGDVATLSAMEISVDGGFVDTVVDIVVAWPSQLLPHFGPC